MSGTVSFEINFTPPSKSSQHINAYEPRSILNVASGIGLQFTQAQNDKAEHGEVPSVRSNAQYAIEQLHPDSKGLAPIG